MSDPETKYNEARYNEAKEIIQGWASKTGHDRCWHHPEILEKLASIFGVPLLDKPHLPSRQEFECECTRYQDQQYGVKTNEKSSP